MVDAEELRPHLTSTCFRHPQPLLWFRVRTLFFNLASNHKLELVFLTTIILNTVMLAADMYPIQGLHLAVVHNANLVFLCVYTAECAIKLLGFGAKACFTDGWYVSDFVLVVVSIALRVTGGQSGVESLRIMRVFRIIVLASKIPNLVALIDVLVRTTLYIRHLYHGIELV